MSLRCINQHFPEQFRRVMLSDCVIVLTGCSTDRPFSSARGSQKVRISTKFNQLSASRVGVGARARWSSCCSFLEIRKVFGVGSVSHRNFRAQGLSFDLYRNASSSEEVVGFGELRATQHFSSSLAVSTMRQKKKREVKELKKGTVVWKEKQKVKNLSTAAEVCMADEHETAAKAGENDEMTNSPSYSKGAQTTAPVSIASAENADQEVALEETITREVQVDAMLLRFLVGKGGSTKEKIEKDCKVKLKVPSAYEAKTWKSGCTVTGSQAGIEAAQKKIKSILDEAVQIKLQYTHFISLPLATHPALLEQVEKFQERILVRNQPKTATSSSGGDSGTSDHEKFDVTDKAKTSVNWEEEEKNLKAQTVHRNKERGVLEDEVKIWKAKIFDKEKEKDTIMDEESPKTAIPDTKKRPFEEEEEEEDEVKSSKAQIMDTEHGVMEETASKTEVMEMEKGVVEAKVIPHKSGIDKSIFVKPRTFHLTVLMLKLWNEERVQQAAEVLEKAQAAVHEALEGSPVVLDFKGVETLKGKPEKAHVLFARVEDSPEKTRLLQVCQVLIEAYVESGLVMEKDIGQALKLHATLMNTTHRTVKKNHRFGKRIPFDATEILEQYGEWKWGEFVIQEAHLSQRFVYDENGYYHCVNSIPLPS